MYLTFRSSGLIVDNMGMLVTTVTTTKCGKLKSFRLLYILLFMLLPFYQYVY